MIFSGIANKSGRIKVIDTKREFSRDKKRRKKKRTRKSKFRELLYSNAKLVGEDIRIKIIVFLIIFFFRFDEFMIVI